MLVPTRELAMQVAEVVEALASSQQLRVVLLYGGRSLRPEYAALRKGPHILIATPGRTLEHLRQGTLDLGSVRFLVLDEADEMLDRGFAPDVESIIGRTPNERQTALLSATMPEWVAKTADRHLRQAIKVKVDTGMHSPPTVEHLVYTIQKGDKLGGPANAAGPARRYARNRLWQDQTWCQTTGKQARFVGLLCRSAPRKT